MRRNAIFVEPLLVAEIAFAEWTHTGAIRQPAYKGLRSDKYAREVVRESARFEAGPGTADRRES